MNPLTNMRNVTKLSQRELDVNSKVSWHDEYRYSAWIFVGGLPFDLTEGDILAIFSQYGEIVNLNLVRDKATGKSKGFCFICYENQKSTVLTVDNLNGTKILGRSIRVDHVKDYKPPKDSDKLDDITRMIHAQGVAPETMQELEKSISAYDVVEEEEDVDNYRDDGVGSHSVLKGFKDSYSSIKQERLSPTPTRNDRRNDRIKKEDEYNQRDRRDTREIRERERESKRKHSPSPRRERQSRTEIDDRGDSKKKHKSHSSSKKSKKSKHSKSKKDKKRSKHKKRKASSSENSDSSSSESSDSSESESEESSDDDSHRKSKKHRRHKK